MSDASLHLVHEDDEMRTRRDNWPYHHRTLCVVRRCGRGVTIGLIMTAAAANPQPQRLRGGCKNDKGDHGSPFQHEGPAPAGVLRHQPPNNVSKSKADRDAEVEGSKPPRLCCPVCEP